MMWTYTAYILYKYYERKNNPTQITFKELVNFIFNILWREFRVAFHDSKKDLFLDLEYLESLKVIKLEKGGEHHDGCIIKIVDPTRLKKIADVVEESYSSTGIELLQIYSKKINAAINEI